MEDVVARLWELSENDTSCERRPVAILIEAQHLWKTLETVLTTQKAHELRVHHAVFTELLACVRSVFQKPQSWRADATSSVVGATKSIFESAARVLVKVGCRGEEEREAIIRDGFAVLLVECLQNTTLELTIGDVAAVLHVFQTLAFDTKHRVALMECSTVSSTLDAMKKIQLDLNVQLFGCKFLQFMAYEEETKELIIHSDGIAVLLGALDRFSTDVQLATSVSDVLYFLSLDLENALSQQQEVFASTMEAILDHVVQLLLRYPEIDPIQTHGVAILLTFSNSHATARLFLCTLADQTTLWAVAKCALDANEDAMADTISLLHAILQDVRCYERLQAKDHSSPLASLLAGLTRLQTTRNRSKSRELAFTIDRLQTLMAIASPVKQVLGAGAINVDSEVRPAGQPQKTTGTQLVDGSRSQLGKQQQAMANDEDATDDSERYLDQDSPMKEDMASSSSDYNYFDQFVEGDDSLDSTDKNHQRDHEEAKNSPHHRVLHLSRSSDYTLNSPNCIPLNSSSTASTSLGTRANHQANGANGNKPTGLQSPSATPQHCRCVFSQSSSANSTTSATNWQNQHSKARRDLQDVEGEYQLLQENYAIVVRRAQEQSKLLNIQNSRIKHHMEVHQQVLDRVKALETALSDAMRKHQVERELRLAEVAQSEKISFSLHDAMTEIKTLNKHNSDTSRELLHKEKLRVDYQQKASTIRQLQQKLEYERDDAVLQMLAMKTEQNELAMRLEETRMEAQESLRMREEDVDAPKLSVFSELLHASPSSRARKASNSTLTTKRVPAEMRHHEHHRNSMHAMGSYHRVVRPADASVMRKASVYGDQLIRDQSSRVSTNVMVMDGHIVDDYDDDESMMEPPKEDLSYSGLLRPHDANATQQRGGLDKHEIEHTLRATYESFDKSPDSDGVHLATVRRFFHESGIVHPPLVSGDVDTILTKVLNQAQENRKRIIVRKDFTMATYPGGMGTSTHSGRSKTIETKRLRFFDEETFFEAVTLLSMRRFPRHDAKKALDVFITDFLHPMQRQQQQQQQLLMHRRSSTGSASSSTYHHNTPVRSGSLGGGNGSGGNGGGSSPTAACIGILKAVLNGLALHIGRDDDEAKQTDPRFLTKLENSTNTLLMASNHHARKPKPEDVVYSMLEMHAVLSREYKPLATICEFYSAIHHTPRELVMMKDDSVAPLSFELVLAFAMDFEIIPSFMDRLSLKYLHSEVSGYLKKFLALQKKMPPLAHVVDAEILKKVMFSMFLARLAMELLSSKREYETPEKQITALIQWLDNSVGREKIQKKAMLPVVIKFSRKLYALRV